jgi:hypothetical protein
MLKASYKYKTRLEVDGNKNTRLQYERIIVLALKVYVAGKHLR